MRNIIPCYGNGILGWPSQAPFDRIIVTAAPKNLPSVFLQQLKDGGVMIIPIGRETGPQKLVKVRRFGESIEIFDIRQVRFVPLID